MKLERRIVVGPVVDLCRGGRSPNRSCRADHRGCHWPPRIRPTWRSPAVAALRHSPSPAARTGIGGADRLRQRLFEIRRSWVRLYSGPSNAAQACPPALGRSDRPTLSVCSGPAPPESVRSGSVDQSVDGLLGDELDSHVPARAGCTSTAADRADSIDPTSRLRTCGVQRRCR